jgi:hypothetical protein
MSSYESNNKISSHSKPDIFYCKIYSADNCHELIGTDTYYIDENWHWTYVSVNINQKGKNLL